MTKKELIIIAIVIMIIIIGVAGYFYWGKRQVNVQPAATPQTLTETASQGVLPSINANPLQNAPDLNPVNKTNPFTNIKTNPF